MPPEHVIQLAAHPIPRVLQQSARPPQRWRHLLAIQPVQLRIEIFRQQPFRRTQLQHIGKVLIQFLQVKRHLRRRPAQPRVELRRERAQQVFVYIGMDAPHARKFRGLLDQTHGLPRPGSFLQQHADIHPLIASQIRHITQNAVLERISRFFIRSNWRHGSPLCTETHGPALDPTTISPVPT